MHKIIIILLFFCISIFANQINLNKEELSFLKSNPAINVGVETNWPPFDFVEKGKYRGIAENYLKIISKNTGLKFNYIKSDSWAELQEFAKQGKIDLLPILVKNNEREKYLLFTDHYIEIRGYIFSTKNFNSMEELFDKTIVIPKGYAQEQFLKEKFPSIKILYVNNLLDAIDAVVTKKADALISNPANISYLTKKYSISGISARFPIPKGVDRLAMGVIKDKKILLSILQKGLNSISLEQKNSISNNWIGGITINKNLTKFELDYIEKNRKLIIGNEFDWIPYDYNEGGKAKGYVIDYIKLLSTKVGFEPVFDADKWDNLIQKIKTNRIDVLPVLTYNKQRENYLYFTDSYSKQKLSIVVNAKLNSLNLLEDLDYKKVALVKNWNSTKAIQKNYPLIDVKIYDSLIEVLDAVSKGEADATIQNDLISNYYINTYYRDSLKITGEALINGYKNRLYMGVSKDKKIVTSILNKAMKQVSESEIRVLENKWFNITKNLNFTNKELDFINNTTIQVAFNDFWAPINFVSDGQAYGMAYDFWQYIVKKANLKTKMTFKQNFSNTLEDIKNKKLDVVLATSETPDRSKYSIFSDIYYKTPIGIATLKDQNYIPNGSYLEGKKVAVGNNYTAHRLLRKAYPKIDFVPVVNIEEGLELLSNNKVFAFVDNMPVLAHNIKKLGFSNNIKISGNTGIDFNLQLMYRDDFQTLQSIVNKVLKHMTPIEKEEIYNKWAKLEYTTSFDYSTLWKYFLPLIIIIAVILYKNRQLVKYQNNLKNTQKELENTLTSFKTLVNLTIEGILIIKDKEIVFCNNEALKMFNLYQESELLGEDINKLFKRNEQIEIEDIIEKSDSSTYELTGIKNTSVQFPTLVKAKKSYFENSSAIILSIIDMSEIKDKENLLIQQSKMASLGEMIGNIAHQWRQPLSFISTASSGMKLQKEFDQLDDKIFIETLDGINETTKFLSQTIEDFQNYLKDDKVKKEFNVNNSIEKILNIVKGSFVNHYITVKLDLSKDLILNGYENELNQALLNILNNSKDALKDIDKNERYVFIKSYQNANNILIEIIDNAGGVPQEIIQKVFEPYFTTKHKSQGTGLGLYMTHKIIHESMKGEIRISNISTIIDDKKFDKCAKVTITLPVS